MLINELPPSFGIILFQAYSHCNKKIRFKITFMKNTLTALLVLMFVTGYAQTSDQSITRFRNIPWGSHRDSISVAGVNLEFVKDRNSLIKNSYVVVNDNMTIGNVRLTKVNYIFNDEGRFTKVYVEGLKEDAEQMRFILEYKFGPHKNESRVDNITYKQWIVRDVTFTLGTYDFLKFELKIESNWQASEAYKKNTTVEDF